MLNVQILLCKRFAELEDKNNCRMYPKLPPSTKGRIVDVPNRKLLNGSLCNATLPSTSLIKAKMELQKINQL